MTINSYSGLEVFVSVGGRLFKPEDLGMISVDIIDSDEGDNEVEIQCLDNDFRIADSSLFRIGQLLSVKWGYTTTGEFSEERTGYVILKPSTDYTKDGVISKIKAKTKSATLASRRPQRNYGKTSLRSIVQEIATRNGLELKLEGGTETLDGFSQGAWSDRQTLRTLADRFGYQVSYESNTINFSPRDFSATPKLTLRYAMGEAGNVLDAHLRVDDHSNAGAATGTQVATHDPKTKTGNKQDAGKPKQELAIFAGTGAAWTQKALGDTKTESSTSKVPGVNATGIVGKLAGVMKIPQSPTGGVSDAAPKDVMALLSSPDTIAGNSAAHATSLTLRHQKKHGELSLDTPGIPHAKARMIVSVEGLAKRDSGLYYVAKVHHKIKIKSYYETSFELNRHGTNAGGGPKTQAPVNTQKAADEASKPKTVLDVSAVNGSNWKRKS